MGANISRKTTTTNNREHDAYTQSYTPTQKHKIMMEENEKKVW
jgi:hypothetical protein